MKTQLHDIIRKRLKKFHKRALAIAFDSGWYTWAKPRKAVELLNDILKGIPESAWPKNDNLYRLNDLYGGGARYKIASRPWTLKLMWDGEKRHADLKHNQDDHTAWVYEPKRGSGIFKDFDIGGS